jgi:hypothetical protein
MFRHNKFIIKKIALRNCCAEPVYLIDRFELGKLSDFEYYTPSLGHAVAYMIEALCYKIEGRGFESR